MEATFFKQPFKLVKAKALRLDFAKKKLLKASTVPKVLRNVGINVKLWTSEEALQTIEEIASPVFSE